MSISFSFRHSFRGFRGFLLAVGVISCILICLSLLGLNTYPSKHDPLSARAPRGRRQGSANQVILLDDKGRSSAGRPKTLSTRLSRFIAANLTGQRAKQCAVAVAVLAGVATLLYVLIAFVAEPLVLKLTSLHIFPDHPYKIGGGGNGGDGGGGGQPNPPAPSGTALPSTGQILMFVGVAVSILMIIGTCIKKHRHRICPCLFKNPEDGAEPSEEVPPELPSGRTLQDEPTGGCLSFFKRIDRSLVGRTHEFFTRLSAKELGTRVEKVLNLECAGNENAWKPNSQAPPEPGAVVPEKFFLVKLKVRKASSQNLVIHLKISGTDLSLTKINLSCYKYFWVNGSAGKPFQLTASNNDPVNPYYCVINLKTEYCASYLVRWIEGFDDNIRKYFEDAIELLEAPQANQALN